MRNRSRQGGWLVMAAIVGLAMLIRPAASLAQNAAFAQQIDLETFRLLAVQHEGRTKTLDTLCREVLEYITGKSRWNDQDPVFTYFDLMFRPERYLQTRMILVKKAPIRATLLQAAGTAITVDEARQIDESKRFPPTLLNQPDVAASLEELERNVMTTERDVDAIHAAMNLMRPVMLQSLLRLVPPPGGDEETAWLTIGSVAGMMPNDSTHAGMMDRDASSAVAAATRDQLSANWLQLRQAWQAEDASGVTKAANALANVLPRVAPSLYPPERSRELEHWYNKYDKLTWTWAIYMVAIPLLVMAVVNKWGWARRAGMLFFVIAFVMHTASMGVRWYLAGRIPNSNMFEAVLAAAWFGGAFAWVLEVALRRRAMRGLFALSASVFSMGAMMCGHFMPTAMNSNITNTMPILRTVWLKIHTNLVLASYMLIALGFVTAAIYLIVRVARRWGQVEARLSSSAGQPVLATNVGAPGGGFLAYATQYDRYGEFRLVVGASAAARAAVAEPSVREDASFWRRGVGAVVAVVGSIGLAWLLAGHVQATWLAALGADPSGVMVARLVYLVLVVATIAFAPALAVWLLAGTGRIVFGRDEAAHLVQRAPLLAVLDGTTMILMELAFIALWTGIILGAAWADVSWGRPWGWDPKEVFALNTWIIFLILVHVRLKVQDKGLWTAILAVIGFVVMMFNWIGVNFYIVGLHSYA